jgi:hypothetical protein
MLIYGILEITIYYYKCTVPDITIYIPLRHATHFILMREKTGNGLPFKRNWFSQTYLATRIILYDLYHQYVQLRDL